MRRAVGAALVAAFCWAAAPAGAETRALLEAPRAEAVAIAGGEVVVGRVLGREGIAVDAVAVTGGPPRRLLTVPAARRDYAVHVDVAASSERVAVTAYFENDEGVPSDSVLFAGPPAGPLDLVRRVRMLRRGRWIPIGIDVDGHRVLVTELNLVARRARVRALGEPVFPWTGEVTAPVALSGDRVAFLGSPRRRRHDRIVVADRRTGATELSIRLRGADVEDGELDLAPDGRVVVAADGRLLTAAPGLAAREIAGSRPAVGGIGAFALPRFAGARVVAAEASPFDAHVPLALEPRLQLGPPSSSLDAVAASPAGAAWIANGCVLFSDLAGGAVTVPVAGPCPRAEAAVEEGSQTMRNGRVRLAVTCVAAPAGGCRGWVGLRERFVLGRAAFRVPAGTRRLVAVRLTRRGLRLVRREIRLHGDAFPRIVGQLEDGRIPDLRGRGAVIDQTGSDPV